MDADNAGPSSLGLGSPGLSLSGSVLKWEGDPLEEPTDTRVVPRHISDLD